MLCDGYTNKEIFGSLLTYLKAHATGKMAGSNFEENPIEMSKKLIKFSATIKKIPEFWKFWNFAQMSTH